MSLNLDCSTWRRVKFSDAVTNVNERVDDPASAGVDRYVGLEHLDPGSMTVTRWGTPDQVEATKLRFQAGDVIFGRRRAYQKKVARADFEGICSAHAMVLRAKSEIIDPDFLPVFLSSDYFLDRAIQISVGSLSPTVNWKTLAVQEFDLPPLADQRRIADLLWAIERHIRSLQSLVMSLDKTLVARVSAALAHAEEWVPILSVAEVLDSQRVPVNASERLSRPGSVPYYGAGGQVGTIDEHLFDEDLVLVGEDATLAVYRVSGPAWVNNHAHVLRPVGVSQDGLFFALTGIDLERFATNGTRLKLTRASLDALKVPSPREIDAMTEGLRPLEAAAERTRVALHSSSELRTSLLFTLFEESR